VYTAQSKKITILAILEVLNKYSDAEHTLSGKDIVGILERDYGLKVDRKTVKRNLMDLLDLDYEIEFSETPKRNPMGEEEYITSDWYILHKFDNSELRLLIDSVLSSKNIPPRQCKELVRKLTELTSTYFKSNVKHIENIPMNQPKNPDLFYTIEILNEAITKKRKVSFNYLRYEEDKKPHPRTAADGEPTLYVYNPYQMVTANGRYYLVGNHDKYDDIANVRIDRIVNIRMLSAPAKPKSKVKGLEFGLDLPKHMAEHVYMYSGDSVHVKFKAPLSMLDATVDWFGLDFDVKRGGKLHGSDEDACEITVRVNADAMFYWALQYGNVIEVLSPKNLRDKLAKAAENMVGKYGSVTPGKR
jgi:predicted DNA-binding transcriptional regulator YafY